MRNIGPDQAKVTGFKWLKAVPHEAGSAAGYDVGQLQFRMVVQRMVKGRKVKPAADKGVVQGGHYRFNLCLHAENLASFTTKTSTKYQFIDFKT